VELILTTTSSQGQAMTQRPNYLILVALLTFVEWASGCVGTAATRSEALSTVSEETQPASAQPSPISGTATVTTGTATLHPQKDSPVKTERVTSEMLEQTGATHVGQSLQDVPGIQLGR
jgi:outer membrane receptor protein involved in Fe transport